MKADVGEISRSQQRAREAGHVEDAEAYIVLAQYVENPLIKPGLMAELQHVTKLPGQEGEKAIKPLIVSVHIWRKLVEQRPQLLFEKARPR